MHAPLDEQSTVTLLRRTVAVFALVLLASTWVLWTPQSVFPQIPLFATFGSFPVAADWAGFAALVATSLIVLIAPRASRWWRFACAGFVVAFILMVLIDQHRLQPWAYQFALLAAVLALVPDRWGLKLARILTIAIYLHSALSKLDYSFLDSYGQYLIQGLTNLAGVQLEKWSPTLRREIAAILPVGELLIAAGLCLHRTRLIRMIGSVVMHGLLIAALGPWSLDHEMGVLIWNAYFIVQNILLFGLAARENKSSEPAVPVPRQLGRITSTVVIALAVLLPFLEPFEYFDVWPSWALYASRPARVRVFVDGSAKASLPEYLLPYVQEARFTDELCPLRIDRWSLGTTRAPVYPQARFELGVALSVAQIAGLDEEVHVEIESAADRWTGKRNIRKHSGVEAIRKETERFWLNSQPRNRAAAMQGK